MDFVRTLNQVQHTENGTYGTRACDLAHLRSERVETPEGFVITTAAWDAFFKEVKYKADFILQQVSSGDDRTLANAYNSIRKLILNTALPDKVLAEVRDSYESLGVDLEGADEASFVTMLASPTYVAEAESYEGVVQNVRGFDQVVRALKELFAMAYTPEAIKYRKSIGVRSFSYAIIVELMPEAVASASAYSTDPQKPDHVFVLTYKGFSDLRDVVAKDYFHVKKEFLTLAGSEVVEQTRLVTRADDGSLETLEYGDRGQSLNDKQVMEVARIAKKSEKALGNPLKLFLSVTRDERYVLLFANRYAIPKGREAQAEVASVPERRAESLAAAPSAVEESSQEESEQAPVASEDAVEDELDFEERETGDEVEEERGPDEGEEPVTADGEVEEEPEEYEDDEGEDFAVEEDGYEAEEPIEDEDSSDEEPSEEDDDSEDDDEESPEEDADEEYDDESSDEEYEYEDEPSEEDASDEDSSDEYEYEPSEDGEGGYEEDVVEEPSEEDDDEEYEYEDEPSEDDEYEDEPSEEDDSEQGAEEPSEEGEDEPSEEDGDEFILDDVEDDEQASQEEDTASMINKSFRIIYSELSKRYEAGGEQAPETITELIQQGVQKGVFEIEGLQELPAIKRKARSGDDISEDERSLVLSVLERLTS